MLQKYPRKFCQDLDLLQLHLSHMAYGETCKADAYPMPQKSHSWVFTVESEYLCLHKNLYMNIYSNPTHKHTSWKYSKCLSTDGWTNMIHPFKGILFRYKKKWMTDKLNNLDESTVLRSLDLCFVFNMVYDTLKFLSL